MSQVPPCVLKIDSDNYFYNNPSTRPRSFSFTNGTLKPVTTIQLEKTCNNALDLDMFYTRESNNHLVSSPVTFSPAVAKPPSPYFPKVSPTTLTSCCARTCSYHNMFCSCLLSCCCHCDSLLSLDRRFSSAVVSSNCQQKQPEHFSVSQSLVNKVGNLLLGHIAKFLYDSAVFLSDQIFCCCYNKQNFF